MRVVFIWLAPCADMVDQILRCVLLTKSCAVFCLPNPALCLASQAGKMTSARDHALCSSRKLPRRPRPFSECFWSKTQKKNLANIQPYYPTALRRVQITKLVQISRGICTPEDRLDWFPAVDQSVSWISRANSVPLRILLSRIARK